MHKKINRRTFLKLSSLAAASFAAGCAVNPVTGKNQLMLVSENQEIALDKQSTPHQFSADYGISQDQSLNWYLDQTGRNLAALSHRPNLPYSFKCVNATYVNAYAFPGGSIAVTRGILLELENEAQLAALLGHELGHVNARHTAQQMSKGTLVQALAGGLSIAAGSRSNTLGELASTVTSLGAGALLASYSRDNEREADALGLGYMVRAGYNPAGTTGLMNMLNRTAEHNPSAIELMFATHPMSSERLHLINSLIQSRYSNLNALPLHRERYMDNTAKLRAMQSGIEELQKGEKEIGKKNLSAAESHIGNALKKMPGDYAALTIMSKVKMLQENFPEAYTFAKKGEKVNPQEAQCHYLSGLASINTKNFPQAYKSFSTHKKILPGNPESDFFLGLSLEGMQNVKEASRLYYTYLQQVNQGKRAQYAYKRLVDWGMIKK